MSSQSLELSENSRLVINLVCSRCHVPLFQLMQMRGHLDIVRDLFTALSYVIRVHAVAYMLDCLSVCHIHGQCQYR